MRHALTTRTVLGASAAALAFGLTACEVENGAPVDDGLMEEPVDDGGEEDF
jgi:hypothetical protein